MDKLTVLEAIRDLAAAGELSESEVVAAARNGAGASGAAADDRRNRYSRVLFFIGGGVICIGIVALIGQVWNDLGPVMHVVVTLGSGLAAYTVGVLFSWSGKAGAAGPAFFLVAALVLPLGIVVAMDEAGLDPEKLGLQSLTAVVLLGVFLGTYLLFRNVSLLVYVIGYGIWAFFAITEFMAGPSPRFDQETFIEYRILAVGLTLMFLAWAFAGTRREILTAPLYALGSLAFLGSALALGGWKPNQNMLWELAFPGLVFAVVYLSVHVRSMLLLVIGSLFFGGYLAKITGEYFSDSLGWPVALILLGFMLMGVGYLTFRLKQTYLKA